MDTTRNGRNGQRRWTAGGRRGRAHATALALAAVSVALGLAPATGAARAASAATVSARANSPAAVADGFTLPANCTPTRDGATVTVSCVYGYIGAEQTFSVPPGITSLSATAVGAPGGTSEYGGAPAAAHGAIAHTVLNVSPSETLYVEVGGAGGQGQFRGAGGARGFNGGGAGGGGGGRGVGGGGGGGASDVRTVPLGVTGSLASRLLVAAGGGGSDGYIDGGGDAGQAGAAFTTYPPTYEGGQPGTGSGGGAGGQITDSSLGGSGGDGSLGGGGSGGGSSLGAGGGGGGGGLYGGGGGSAVAGGGGGQSLGASYGTDYHSTTPSVTLSYTLPVAPTESGLSCEPSPLTLGSSATCTATVTDTSAMPVVPSGAITLTLGGGTSGGGAFTPASGACTLVPVAGSVSTASCSVAYTPAGVGISSLWASYGGDSIHTDSRSTPVQLRITPQPVAPTQSGLSCTPNPLTYGSGGTTCTATVTDLSASPVAPSGPVTLTLGGGALGTCTVTPVAGSAGTASCTVDYTPARAGTAMLTADYGGDSTHTNSRSMPVPLQVSPAPLTITANDKSMTYGSAVPLSFFDASYVGFVNGDSAASLGNPPQCQPAGSAARLPVGTYAITCTGAQDPNYTISYKSGTLTITPAPLTITANSPRVVYNGTVPAITPSYSGFVVGDSARSLTTAPTCTSTAPTDGAAGSYPTSCTGAADPNYSIGYIGGTLVIAQAAQAITVTATAPSSARVGTTYTASATGGASGQPVTFSASPSSVCTSGGANGATISFVGAGACVVTASQAGDQDYLPAPAVTQTVMVIAPLALDVSSSPPGSATTGSTVTLTDTLTNNSALTQTVRLTTTLTYLSWWGGLVLGTVRVPVTLAPGQTLGRPVRFTIGWWFPRGTYTLDVRASDANGDTASASTTLTISGGPWHPWAPRGA